MYEEVKKRIHPREERDFSFSSFLQDLITMKMIDDSMAEGIAKQAIDKGVESLSDPQVYRLINKGLLPHNYVSLCTRCYQPIPWEEMFYALNDELCSWCRKMEENDK